MVGMLDKGVVNRQLVGGTREADPHHPGAQDTPRHRALQPQGQGVRAERP